MQVLLVNKNLFIFTGASGLALAWVAYQSLVLFVKHNTFLIIYKKIRILILKFCTHKKRPSVRSRVSFGFSG